jgi:hypothetical protein
MPRIHHGGSWPPFGSANRHVTGGVKRAGREVPPSYPLRRAGDLGVPFETTGTLLMT